jgi:hypothetical protein
MPEKLIRMTYIDDDPYQPEDEEILNLSKLDTIKPVTLFTPSLPDRFAKIQLMPPPSETSVAASRALAKEFKGLMTLQAEGKLPFYMDPESER